MTKIQIKADNENKKLYELVQLFFISKTKSAIKKMINNGEVKVNYQKVFDNYLLQIGDEVIFYKKTEAINQNFLKTTVTAKIFYEDDNIIIIDKNKGLICHEDVNEKFNTLNNFLKKNFYIKGKWNGIDKATEPVLVNRIDQNTSGLVLGANNKSVLTLINKSQNDNKIVKVYLAVVHGKFRNKAFSDQAFIYQNAKNKMEIIKKPNEVSKPIKTQFELIETNQEFSLVKATITNAKKHQIRAHLAYLGHPIVGDYKYMNQKYFSPYKSQILIANEIIFNFEEENKLFYLNKIKFRKHEYKDIDLNSFIKKYV